MADNKGVVRNPADPKNVPDVARSIVYDQVKARLELTDTHITFMPDEVYIVWFAFTLGNWKALASTTLPDGRYYEVTYNKAKNEIYVDTYLKVDNVCIDNPF